MSWNFRVMRHEDGGLAVHEVHYDAAGRPRACSAEPATFAVPETEDAPALTRNLLRAARNARTLPVLERSDFEREA